ncbi:MFS transporter [Cerasicoccus arenae]|uniref:MFS transporter n=1 Tax=Cerasicoccus arenae TaxID=424488 RepID=UPI00167731D1|nr:MFS transporter [Cerasicoccus arenae]MBK1856970.1 MFS transporter [Cerasicoccus arenae]
MENKEQRNLRLGILEGLLATPWMLLSLPAGFIISGLLTLYYDVSPVVYGIIASLPAWSNALQIVLTPVVAKFLNARDLALVLSWMNLGLWCMLAAVLGYLPPEDSKSAGQVFLIFFSLAALSQSLAGVGWTAWVQQWTPTKVRGAYFGNRNRQISIATVGFLLIAMGTLNWFGESIWAYQTLIIVALLCRFFSLLWQHLIVTPPEANGTLVTEGWLRELAGLRKHKNFLLLIAFGSWCGFWMSLTGPFIPRFVYEHLSVLPWQFALVNILATLSGALTLPLWGKVIDRHGCIPVMMISLSLWQAQNYLWCILTPSLSWLLYPMWFWGGMVGNAYLLGLFNLIFKIIPKQGRTAAISANIAVTSVAAAIAPVLAGQIIEMSESLGWPILTVYRIGFALGPTSLLLSLLILRKIKEPEIDGEGSVMGAMRSVRQILQIQGLNFLANASFVSPIIKRKK